MSLELVFSTPATLPSCAFNPFADLDTLTADAPRSMDIATNENSVPALHVAPKSTLDEDKDPDELDDSDEDEEDDDLEDDDDEDLDDEDDLEDEEDDDSDEDEDEDLEYEDDEDDEDEDDDEEEEEK